MYSDAHTISLDELYSRLDATTTGLTTNEAFRRQITFGKNELKAKKKPPIIIRFGKHLINYFAILLWIGSILSFAAAYFSSALSYLYIGIALASVVILNAIFTFIQEYRSEKIMESFKKMIPSKIEVLRDGAKKEIIAENLVPGDIIFFAEGDKIPADARLIAENILKVDNSPLTGESEPQLRKLACTHRKILESRNMVFSGTLVQAGNGQALVYGTGMNTQIGKIVELTRETKEVLSPLKKQINHFINIISAIAIFLGVVFFIISIIIGDQLMPSIIFAIGIIVANVPEGLLPTVTLALSIAAKKMAKKKALIKKLESVETLGSTTIICTDKTGTLTENKIAVNSILLNLEEKNIDDQNITNTNGLQELLKIAILCNNARFKATEDNINYFGDPTEQALLAFSHKYKNVKELITHNNRIHESPFDSTTKRMISINEANKEKTAYLKGAPEIILEKCTKILINNKIIPLTTKYKDEIVKYYRDFAQRGERVLALAYKAAENAIIKEQDFIFVALIGMTDPLRKEIPDAIKKCKSAGIRVIMLTGDYSLTAVAIAKQCGILNNDTPQNIMAGEELDQIDDRQLQQYLAKGNNILARISPPHKLRIVQTLQQMGEVVTVTGDGVNDAPALKNADMGVAMGISGTEVAKEAANMVLLDDNFATIVHAIEEGRNIYNNIKKFVVYILTSNIPEILPFIAFAMLGIPLPLNVVLILAIDLGTDLLPALGLATETAEIDIMSAPPRPKQEQLLTPIMLFRSYGIVGMLEAAAGFVAFFIVLYSGGWHWGIQLGTFDPLYLQAVAAFFASIILCQIINVQICRTQKQSIFHKGIFTNKLILFGIITEILLLAIIIYNPFTQSFFGTANLNLLQLLLATPFMLLILCADEIRKFLIRKGNNFTIKYLNW